MLNRSASERAALKKELAELTKAHAKALAFAIYVRMNSEEDAAYEMHADRIAEIKRILAAPVYPDPSD